VWDCHGRDDVLSLLRQRKGEGASPLPDDCRPPVNDAALTGLNAEAGLFFRGQANLTKWERELYRWILTNFGAGRPPSLADLSKETMRLKLDRDQVLERMEAADLIRRDPDSGAVSVAYPFSALPTLHTLDIDGVQGYAMCAVDALGVAFMLNKPVTVTSRDPLTGDEVRVRVDADTGTIDAAPGQAVALAGHVPGAGALASSCCPVTNFFASETNARAYLAQNPGIDGQVVSIAQAADAGRALFGQLLTHAVKVEVLYFDGCPSYQALIPVLRELLADEGVEDEIELRRIETAEDAERERFLGSPSIRINGSDIEPLADDRHDFGMKCRLYRNPEGLTGIPTENWLVAALRNAAAN
jgi:hypothetical protein